jgi:hypothetical protein
MRTIFFIVAFDIFDILSSAANVSTQDRHHSIAQIAKSSSKVFARGRLKAFLIGAQG